MLSSLLVRFRCLWTDQLIRPCWFLVCFLGVFVCFVWFWVFCCFFVLHGDSSMEYVSIQFSSLLYAHCHYDWCCHCINSVNLHNAIVFRLDKQPDEAIWRWTEKMAQSACDRHGIPLSPETKSADAAKNHYLFSQSLFGEVCPNLRIGG